VTEFDFKLIEKIRTGDEQSFTILVKSYTPYIYRIAFALLQDRREAEDVSQEVFLKIYRSIGQLSNPQAFHSWLNKIITHTSLDRLRLKKQYPIPIAESELNMVSQETSSQLDQHLLIRDALQRLSREYRETLVFREWQGYSYEEIANIMKVPVGTVKSRIHTARLQLRKILSEGEREMEW
jgi:RNA polymerase sigma-70 factor (ECF subfamily)